MFYGNLSRTAALIVALATCSVADAAECPWADEETITVTHRLRFVTVNNQTFQVNKSWRRAEFERILTACDLGEARDSFRRWRLTRRWTNGLAVAGALTYWPVIVSAAVPGVVSSVYSLEMQRDMEREWLARKSAEPAVNETTAAAD